jgi:uncharacterized protein (TIGR03546 family)
MFLLTFIRKLYKALSSSASPSAVAFAVAFGLIAGCVPVLSNLFFFMLLLTLVFRVQISTMILSWALTRLACMAGLARLFEPMGEKLLEAEALKGFWTWLLNLPVVAWLGLERYAILGGAVVGLVIGAALFVPIRMLVIAYRRFAHEKVSSNKFFRWLTNFWVVKLLRFVFVGSGA